MTSDLRSSRGSGRNIEKKPILRSKDRLLHPSQGNPRIASLGYILYIYPPENPTRKKIKESTYEQDQSSISKRMPSVEKAKED